jgi:hypothetical protein
MFEVIFCWPTISSQDRIAVGVIPRSLLGVGENFISGLDLGEFRCGSLDVSVITVGVKFKSLPPVGLFYSADSKLAACSGTWDA